MDFYVKDFGLDSKMENIFSTEIIGREKEYEQLKSIISEDLSSHLILSGENGIGKTSFLNSIDKKLGSIENYEYCIVIKFSMMMKQNPLKKSSLSSLLIQTLKDIPKRGDEVLNLNDSIEYSTYVVHPEYEEVSNYLSKSKGKLIIILDDISITDLIILKKIPKVNIYNILFIFTSDKKLRARRIFKLLLFPELPVEMDLDICNEAQNIKLLSRYSKFYQNQIHKYTNKRNPLLMNLIRLLYNKLPVEVVSPINNLNQFYESYFQELIRVNYLEYHLLKSILFLLIIVKEDLTMYQIEYFLEVELSKIDVVIINHYIFFSRINKTKFIITHKSIRDFIKETYNQELYQFESNYLFKFLHNSVNKYNQNLKYHIQEYILKYTISHCINNENNLNMANGLILHSSLIEDQIKFFKNYEISIRTIINLIKSNIEFYEGENWKIKQKDLYWLGTKPSYQLLLDKLIEINLRKNEQEK